MKLPSSLLGLPASLLLLLTAQFAHVRADNQRFPTAVRKMGTDASEKFLPEYLAFGEDDAVIQAGTHAHAAVSAPAGFLTPAEEDLLLAANSSASIHYRAPFAAHLSDDAADALDGRDGGGIDLWESFKRARVVEARLGRRDFACPTGSSSCSAIGYPNSCCQTGETCVQITDTGLGPVGCCPSGEACTGTIACSGDQQSCSSESGGGCCIPGWSCASIGCTQSATAAATTTLKTSTAQLTTTSSTSSPTTSSPTSSPSTSQPTTATTTNDASAPVRPTSGTSPSTASGAYCPTGFYACLAVYGGGCCQTGRDCHTTNCPSTAYTTIISSGVTIAVPASDVPASATTTGTCAGGWSLCPTDAGPVAGCCPGGYSCGTASCFLATGSATASVAKELPGSGAVGKGVVRSAVGMMFSVSGFVSILALI